MTKTLLKKDETPTAATIGASDNVKSSIGNNVMNTLTTTNQVVTMSSREIAKLTGKKVSAVHSDIRAMVPALYASDNGEKIRSYAWGTTKNEMISFLNHNEIQGITINFDDRGYVYEFLLDRRHTEILVTGYDIKRARQLLTVGTTLKLVKLNHLLIQWSHSMTLLSYVTL
ncbi:Rha family transcriptional regulator [Providencia vermicola]|nr:Rha family transcriptional regulator [Providencia sp. G1(2023)]MBC8655086.1 Rha family transcriptional regulator [Providencia vermicola]